MRAYEIRVLGHVDPGVLAGLGPLEADERPATTVLRGSLADGDELKRLLDQLHGLGLELLEVQQADEPGS